MYKRQAVSDAKINASINNIKNVTFVNADAGDFLVEYAKNAKADVVIMDPPRSGSTPEFLNSLLKIKPDRIVYISCGPDTQARDIKVLIKGGYKVTACQPFDLFPHTEHVETVVLLSQLKQKPDDYINVTIELDDMDITSAETKATYDEIKKYVAEHNAGMKVSNLYISQVKRKCGIEVGKNLRVATRRMDCLQGNSTTAATDLELVPSPNLPKNEDSRQPRCPEDKESAIVEALKHFKMNS